MNEHAATLYMAQKLMTEAYTLPCALDKTGNIRHDKRWRVRHMHHAEHRGDGRKVVVGNIRFRFTYNGNKRRFTYVWRVGDAKCVLPQPPRPPFAITTSSSVDMSAMMRPVSALRISVPRGTVMTSGCALLPKQRLP